LRILYRAIRAAGKPPYGEHNYHIHFVLTTLCLCLAELTGRLKLNYQPIADYYWCS
jgi:hypothetical protein